MGSLFPRHRLYPRARAGRSRWVPVAGLGLFSGACLLLYACQDLAEPPRSEPISTVPASSVYALGQWGPSFGTQVVAVHASLVQLGAGGAGVLIWGHTGAPHLWNLSDSTRTFAPLEEPVELFCAGHTYLPDGSLLVVGGHDEIKGDGYGIPNVYRFAEGSWVTEAAMSYGRWYPTATTLENGDVLVYAGTDNNKLTVATPELYRFATRGWTSLTSARKGFPWYPRSFLDPRTGHVFYAGELAETRWLDVNANGGLGGWTGVVVRRQVANRNYGSAVMYEPGKILYVGGGGGKATDSIPPSNLAETIDLNQPNPQWVATGSMTYGRRHTNLTILADGKVLVTGGTSSSGFSSRALGRREAEVWDPATGTWTLAAPEGAIRVYHGVSLLLPDGRVLSAGSGDGQNLPRETNGQIFSPPYLFRPDGGPASRPTIRSISNTAVRYGETFSVVTPNAPGIAKVHLIRFSSVTHAFNQSQLLYRAGFTQLNSGALRVTAPASGRLAPPGPYLLFLVHKNGVPSEAKVITLSP